MSHLKDILIAIGLSPAIASVIMIFMSFIVFLLFKVIFPRFKREMDNNIAENKRILEEIQKDIKDLKVKDNQHQYTLRKTLATNIALKCSEYEKRYTKNGITPSAEEIMYLSELWEDLEHNYGDGFPEIKIRIDKLNGLLSVR